MIREAAGAESPARKGRCGGSELGWQNTGVFLCTKKLIESFTFYRYLVKNMYMYICIQLLFILEFKVPWFATQAVGQGAVLVRGADEARLEYSGCAAGCNLKCSNSVGTGRARVADGRCPQTGTSP